MSIIFLSRVTKRMTNAPIEDFVIRIQELVRVLIRIMMSMLAAMDTEELGIVETAVMPSLQSLPHVLVILLAQITEFVIPRQSGVLVPMATQVAIAHSEHVNTVSRGSPTPAIPMLPMTKWPNVVIWVCATELQVNASAMPASLVEPANTWVVSHPPNQHAMAMDLASAFESLDCCMKTRMELPHLSHTVPTQILL